MASRETKTVSGTLVSSKPITLFKAANYISGFAAVDNGASAAVRVYLSRTADAFNRLVQFHKQLKSHHKRHLSDSEVKTETSADIVENIEQKKVKKHRKNRNSDEYEHHASQRINSEVKAGILVEVVQKPEEKKVKKHKKNRSLEAYEQGSLKIEAKGNENYESGSKFEDEVKIDQGQNGVLWKKRKKKDKRGKGQNEEDLRIVHSSDGAVDVQALEVLDAYGKREKIEYEGVEIEDDGSFEVGKGSLKRREKKRKRNDGEERGKSSEVEDGKTTKCVDADYAEAIDVKNQDSKKKRKRRKTEGND